MTDTAVYPDRRTRFWGVGLSGRRVFDNPSLAPAPIIPVPRIHLGFFTNPDGCWDVPAQVERLIQVWDRVGAGNEGLEIHFTLAHLFLRADQIGASDDLIVSQFAAGRLALDRPHPLTGKTDAEMLSPLADVLETRRPVMTWLDTEYLYNLGMWTLPQRLILRIIGTKSCRRAMPTAAWDIDPAIVTADYFALDSEKLARWRRWRDAFNGYGTEIAVRSLETLLRDIGAIGQLGTYGSWTGTKYAPLPMYPGNGNEFSVSSIDGMSASTYLGNWLPGSMPVGSEALAVKLAAVAADIRDTAALVEKFGPFVAVKIDTSQDIDVVRNSIAQAVAQAVGHVLLWDDTSAPVLGAGAKSQAIADICRNELSRWESDRAVGSVSVGRMLRFINNGKKIEIVQG